MSLLRFSNSLSLLSLASKLNNYGQIWWIMLASSRLTTRNSFVWYQKELNRSNLLRHSTWLLNILLCLHPFVSSLNGVVNCMFINVNCSTYENIIHFTNLYFVLYFGCSMIIYATLRQFIENLKTYCNLDHFFETFLMIIKI